MPEVSIVILNHNGLAFLERCIPSVIQAANFYGRSCEIIVVDNASFDGSLGYINSNFAQIKLVALKKNLGFSRAMNIGIKNAKAGIVIGLNNDVIVEQDFISPLVSHFYNNDSLFAVAAKMLLWDKKTLNFGKAVGRFKFGVFRRIFKDTAESSNTLYACGGGFAADKNKFLELGGFDEDVFMYWEDLDLCYRAWKRGWKTVYEPKSIIYHKFHGTSLKKYGQDGISALSGRNYFLFMLKNIHQKSLFYRHLLFLPVLMVAAIFVNKQHFTLGLIRSLKRWPLFIKKRKIEKKKSIYSDIEVLHISSQ